MFRLPDPDAVHNVPVTVPVPTGGADPAQHEIVCHFRLLDRPALNALLERKDDLVFFKAVLAGFDGVGDRHGEPLAFNDTTLETLSAIPYFARAVVDSYLAWANAEPVKN